MELGFLAEIKPVYGMIDFGEERELAKASYQYINQDIQDIKTNFVRLGFHLEECRRMEYYKDFGYDNFYEFVEKNFHMEKSAVSRHINIFMRFSGESGGYTRQMWLDDKYAAYSYSQLSEMLQMKEEQIAQVKPEMTVKEIRELKKSWKKSESCDVATKECKCRKDESYICNIEDIMAKHFMEKGNIIGCAGCCDFCLKKEKCEYVCEYVKKEKRGEPVVVDAEYEEVVDEISPELPILKNVKEREDFILTYKEWNIWCRNERTEETYYRFDLPDGAAIVVRSYPLYLQWKKEETEGKEFFLLKPGYKHFKNCESSMTELKTYLKDLQKNKQ